MSLPRQVRVGHAPHGEPGARREIGMGWDRTTSRLGPLQSSATRIPRIEQRAHDAPCSWRTSTIRRTARLELSEILDPAFQAWMALREGRQRLANSTGTMMRDMSCAAPARTTAIRLENVAIDYLKSAEGAGESSGSPIPRSTCGTTIRTYVLNTPWSTPGSARPPNAFLDFLLSEPVQKRSLEHGLPSRKPDRAHQSAGKSVRRVPALRPQGGRSGRSVRLRAPSHQQSARLLAAEPGQPLASDHVRIGVLKARSGSVPKLPGLGRFQSTRSRWRAS